MACAAGQYLASAGEKGFSISTRRRKGNAVDDQHYKQMTQCKHRSKHARTSKIHFVMSAFDPMRTLAVHRSTRDYVDRSGNCKAKQARKFASGSLSHRLTSIEILCGGYLLSRQIVQLLT
jgi:hypothetical protein